MPALYGETSPPRPTGHPTGGWADPRWVRRRGCDRSPSPLRDLLSGTTRCHRELVGVELTMSDGRTYVPFRHTRRSEARWSHDHPPAVIQPRFHLEVLPPRWRRLHALFRVICIVTTPFFVGLPGFRSKLWMVDPVTGDFAGLYEWDDAATARAYAEGLSRVLRVLSAPGSVSYELVEGSTVRGVPEHEHAALDAGTVDAA